MANEDLADKETIDGNGLFLEIEDEELEASEKEATKEAPEDTVEDDDEVIVSIGEASPASEEDEVEAPVWVKDLRKSHKEQARKIRELEGQLKTVAPQAKPVELGDKPTLESCEYDETKFESELTAYHERKRQVDNEAETRKKEAENAQKAWQDTLAGYETKKVSLRVKDFSEAEDSVKETLSSIQQTIILQGSENSALVVYALGKNKAEASRLAKITDHIKFAFEVAKLEGKLKVSAKKPPPPEKTVKSGGSSFAAATDKTLERLRAEAEKTGDLSKVVAYKRQLKAKGA
jgi:hypothetical protein